MSAFLIKVSEPGAFETGALSTRNRSGRGELQRQQPTGVLFRTRKFVANGGAKRDALHQNAVIYSNPIETFL